VRDLIRIGPAQVVERMGVLPEQVPDFKALAGDASDKIPGAKGIGPKSAAALVLKYGTLEAILDARTDTISPTVAEQLRTYKRIVNMQSDVDVELPETAPPNWSAAAAELRRLGAENSAERIAARTH
jgi:DNA polymerase-1